MKRTIGNQARILAVANQHGTQAAIKDFGTTEEEIQALRVELTTSPELQQAYQAKLALEQFDPKEAFQKAVMVQAQLQDKAQQVLSKFLDLLLSSKSLEARDVETARKIASDAQGALNQSLAQSIPEDKTQSAQDPKGSQAERKTFLALVKEKKLQSSN